MRRLWHTPWRFLLILWTVVPLYFRYFRLWAKKRWFGRSTPPEVWSRVHTKSARAFYRLAVRMRGGLIKVGQIISTRVDIMPPEWVAELSKLQDEVDPQPWKVIRKRLTSELGAPPDELFAEIEEEAVAAASFGQVHRATLKDGRRVALKIQYEDIAMKLSCDLFVFRCAVPLFNVFVPKIRLRTIYEEVKKALTTELDYRQEAEYTRLVGENLGEVPHIVVPRVVEEFTTEHVICTTYFEGFKITDAAKREAAGILGWIIEQQLKVSRLLERAIDQLYIPAATLATKHRYSTLALSIASLLLLLGAVSGGAFKFSFLPKLESDNVVATIELPLGTPIDETKK